MENPAPRKHVFKKVENKIAVLLTRGIHNILVIDTEENLRKDLGLAPDVPLEDMNDYLEGAIFTAKVISFAEVEELLAREQNDNFKLKVEIGEGLKG